MSWRSALCSDGSRTGLWPLARLGQVSHVGNRQPRMARAAFRKGVPTFPGSRGLGRGTRRAQTERRSSAGALLNIPPPPSQSCFAFVLAVYIRFAFPVSLIYWHFGAPVLSLKGFYSVAQEAHPSRIQSCHAPRWTPTYECLRPAPASPSGSNPKHRDTNKMDPKTDAKRLY
jgi:hypothetical protein